MAEAPQLRRVLGLRDVVLFIVVAVVGTRWIAVAAAVGPSALTLWLIAFFALFVPLAFAVVELSSRHPDEGGLYVWTRRAFGDFAGFMSAWMYWASCLAYFPGLLYFVAANALFVAGPAGARLASSPAWHAGASLVFLTIALIPNLLGLNLGKRLHNAGALGSWAPVALLVVMGIACAVRFGPATAFPAAALVPRFAFSDLAMWSTLAFAFGGLETSSLMGGEIRDPRRTIPRAILVGGAIVTAIYLLGTVAILLAIPADRVTGLQGLMQAIDVAAARLGWPGVTPIAAASLTLGGVGMAGAWLAATARLPFVAGVDRFLPAAFGRIHPRWGTPHVAILVQAAGAAAFAVLGQAGTGVQGAYDALVSMCVIAYFIPFLYLFAAWIRLQREPAGPEVRRPPGGRPVAVALASLGFVTTLVGIGLAVVPPGGTTNPGLAVLKVVGSSVVLVVVGGLIYHVNRARALARPRADQAPAGSR